MTTNDEALAAQIAWAKALGLYDQARIDRLRAVLRGDVTLAMLSGGRP